MSKFPGPIKTWTLHQALDKFLAHTGVLYKYFKKDIVLFKEDEVVDEKHNTSRNEPSREYVPDKIHVIITDTVTYSVINFRYGCFPDNRYIKTLRNRYVESI